MDRPTLPRIFSFALFIMALMVMPGCQKEESERPQPEIASSIEPMMPEDVREIFSRSCESCHGPNGQGIMGVAPNLRRIPYRSSEEWDDYLRKSSTVHPVASPRPLWLTADEIKVMANFLSYMGQMADSKRTP